jgi:hypothetical protein
MKWCMLLLAMTTACGSTSLEAAPGERAPSIELHPIAHESICVTKGDLTDAAIREPTVRAYARGAGGDAAQLTFTFNGNADTARALSNGELRRQMGLKLRAQDSCNVVYVMWRLDPRPMLEVSVKANPGKRTHEECGAEGYTKIKPAGHRALPSLDVGSTHTLRAEIVGDSLSAWVDNVLVWSGTLPDDARSIAGPAGMRSDNVKLDGLALFAPRSSGGEAAACKKHEHDD